MPIRGNGRGCRAGCRATRGGPLRTRRRGERGQGLVELVLVLPVLLTVAFGVLELGTLLDLSHSISGLSREGANLAARGASLDSVLYVTVLNGRLIGLDQGGGVIASRVSMQNGVPVITAQLASGGYVGLSRLGPLGAAAAPLVGKGLSGNRTYHVVEVFAPYHPFTPLEGFVESIVPDTLYDRTLF